MQANQMGPFQNQLIQTTFHFREENEMTKEEAASLVYLFGNASYELGYYSRSGSPYAKEQYHDWEIKRDGLESRLIAILCGETDEVTP